MSLWLVISNTGNLRSGNFAGTGVVEISPSTSTPTNSLSSDNFTRVGPGSDLFGGFTNIGVILIEAFTGVLIDGGGRVTVADPYLAPLGDYRGPTLTMAPRPGSPAIKEVIRAFLPSVLPITDQRGFTRVTGKLPDIGAYESGSAAGYGVLAVEGTASGLNMTYTGDAAADGSPNGSE